MITEKVKNIVSFEINNNTSCIVITILGKTFKIKSKKLMLKHVEKMLIAQEKKIDQLELYIKENHYANIFNDSIKDCPWLGNRSFSLTGGSANYSFMYTLFRVLEDIQPKLILEFGLGQTSKLTTQYACNTAQDIVLDIVEHDSEWIDNFSKKLSTNENIHIHKKDIIEFALLDQKSSKYDHLDDIVNDKKYDLIIIDGPYGQNLDYPRTNILDLIPQNLSENFIIILDDVERDGEQNTSKLIFDKLTQNNIDYKFSYKIGAKKQLLITSSDYKFLHWI